MSELKIGDVVTAIYKTGKYIGEITDIRPQHFLVRVLGVLKHPMQGDLHHPKDAEVGIFHERRALAFREQTNVPLQMVKSYDGEVPDYLSSLKTAVEKLKAECLETPSAWSNQSLANIERLEKDYFK